VSCKLTFIPTIGTLRRNYTAVTLPGKTYDSVIPKEPNNIVGIT